MCPPRRLAKLSFSHSANSRGWSLNLLFLFSQAPSRRLQIEAGYGSLSPANEGTTFGAQTSSINYVSSTPAMPNDTSTTATSSPYPSRPCLVLSSRSSTGSFVKGPLQGAADAWSPWPLSRYPYSAQVYGPSTFTVSTPSTQPGFYILLTLSNTSSPGHT